MKVIVSERVREATDKPPLFEAGDRRSSARSYVHVRIELDGDVYEICRPSHGEGLELRQVRGGQLVLEPRVGNVVAFRTAPR